MSIIFYVRVSTLGQAEQGLSLPAQRKLLNRYAENGKLEVDGSFEDVASGRSFLGRPGLMKAVALACSSRRVDELVVHRIDRIARNTLDYLTLKAKLRQHGVRIVSLVEHFDVGPIGELAEMFMAATYEFQSAYTATEVERGLRERLELAFHRAVQKYGVCRRVYYDNGMVYRSGHMKQIVAHLGIHSIVFTKRYRPQGHGKIEALNRYIRSAFIAELKASRITTLDELNEAFVAWADLRYNRRTHSETGQAPRDRWRVGLDDVKYPDEEQIRQAFLWKEPRKADKTGVFSLFATRYQVATDRGMGTRGAA